MREYGIRSPSCMLNLYRKFFFVEKYIFFKQLYLQFQQHLHYLRSYDTNIYAYNILANYTIYPYTTYTCTT